VISARIKNRGTGQISDFELAELNQRPPSTGSPGFAVLSSVLRLVPWFRVGFHVQVYPLLNLSASDLSLEFHFSISSPRRINPDRLLSSIAVFFARVRL
jgi:hypothetical protein